jgi:hypothetical protein
MILAQRTAESQARAADAAARVNELPPAAE